MQKVIFSFFLIFLSLFCFAYQPKETYPSEHSPNELKNLEIKEHLGSSIDENLKFINEESQPVFLKKYFQGLPVLLTIVYYNCPSLCGFHLNGLFEGLEGVSLKAGQDYELVIVSMDDTEMASLAKQKKASYLKKFNLPGKGVHFLTGSKDSISKLSHQVGFAFRWDDETEQFAHSPVAYVLSPKAKISRYLYGVLFESKTLKMSLVEAGQGKIGDVVDRILLFCYRFNPKKNEYTLYAYNVMRLGGALTVLMLLLFLVPMWWREGKKQ